MRNKVQGIISDKRFRQASSLFAVNIVGIPIGLLTSIFLTRYLGADSFGDLKFLQTVFAVAVLVFSFGFFQAGNRALVVNEDKDRAREYYGAELVILVGLFMLMSLALTIYALYDPNVLSKGLGYELLCLIPFGWLYLLLQYFEVLFQADNKIRLLAKVRLYPKLSMLFAVTILYLFFMEIEGNRLLIAFGLYIFVEIVAYVSIIIKLKISFKGLTSRVKEIWGFNRSFGFDVYLGSLFAVGLAQVSGVLISYFGVDNRGVGFYALALALSAPLAFIPNTIATTSYKDFCGKSRIPPQLLMITLIISFLSLISLLVLVPPFVRYFYGSQFESVIDLSLVVSVGVLVHGMADFFNRYLGANGQGRALRNSSFMVGGSALVSNLFLIPLWGEMGAAYARAITGIVYFFIIYYFYRVYVSSNGPQDNETTRG